MAIQLLWSVILATGLLWLPESPRYFVKKGQMDRAATVLERLRDQPQGSVLVQEELAELIANHKYEMSVIPQSGYFSSWANCFRGGLTNPTSNLRRTILGTSLQMMQQLTGVNFMFYLGTTFFTQLGTIKNPFLISLITTLVNVCSTPISFVIIERVGRRSIMIWGALGNGYLSIYRCHNWCNRYIYPCRRRHDRIYLHLYILLRLDMGTCAWVVIGEIFPLPIRSRGVALSTASNWLWNCASIPLSSYLVQ